MARPEKVAEVEAITERMQSAQSMVLADFTGLSVAQMTDFRSDSAARRAVECRVVKNRLARIAADNAETGDHEGPSQGSDRHRVRCGKPGRSRQDRRRLRQGQRSDEDQGRVPGRRSILDSDAGRGPVQDPEQGRVDRQDDGQHQLAGSAVWSAPSTVSSARWPAPSTPSPSRRPKRPELSETDGPARLRAGATATKPDKPPGTGSGPQGE